MYMEIATMSRFVSLFYAIVLFSNNVSGENVLQEEIGTVEAPDIAPLDLDIIHPDMEKALETLEALATKVDKLHLIGEDADEQKEKIYDEMIEVLDGIIEAVKNSNNAYKFLKAKGLDRIVAQNLKIDYDSLKADILLLLKVLFDVAPTTTNALIPITIVDRLLDVFERDNLGLKAHVLDVLYIWLPENPRVQARVMKIKGLAPFYEQVANLDTSVIKTLLDLFNIIMKEHIKARNDNMQRAAIDSDKMKFYVRIGLLEHMATPAVCNGLLNIFAKTWSYNTADNNIIVIVFDMIKNIKPFCMKVYQGKTKPKKLFTALQEYVKDTENTEYFESNGLNVTDISLVIDDYVEKLKHFPKDEM